MSNRITLTSTVVAASDQVSANVADESVILHLKDGVYYGLDPVGARIWSLIQQPRTVSEVRDTIVTEYDVEPARCESDLLVLLEDLAAKRLIEIRGG
jgi:hypothetical protein